MDNHFHFIIHAEEDVVRQFAAKVSLLYKTRRGRKVNPGPLERIKWSVIPIKDLDHLKNSIAYVLRNPWQAGYPYMLSFYPWSTATLYFQDVKALSAFCQKCRSVSALSTTERRSVLGTKCELSEEWLIAPDGYIWPGNYVVWHDVEDLFFKPDELLWRILKVRNLRLMELQQNESMISISDLEVKSAVIKYCKRYFNTIDVLDLNRDQRLQIGYCLIEKLGASTKQLGKVLHLKFPQ